MIVQCPSCSKRYRVNDANIPPSGGKIRCPQCSHSFVVYPESEPEPQETLDPGEKTQVAQRPNMEELLKGMQQSGGVGGAEDEEPETAATEVMSGSELPDFNNLFGGEGDTDDATMEVPNPLHPSNTGGGGGAPGDDLQTQEIDADIAQRSMEQVRDHVDASPPVEGPGGGDDAATQITPPSHLGDIPSPRDQQPSDQQRASAPDGPTPPPGQNPRPGADSGPGSGGFETPSAPASNSPSPGGGPATPGGGPTTPEGDASSPGMEAPASQGPSASSAPSSPQAASGGPDPSHDGPWKLKTNFGLTYEFADNDSLREWIDGRDELDGYELSADDDEFYPLEDFPQVQGGGTAGNNGAGSGRQMASSSGQPPTPGGTSPQRTGSAPGGPAGGSPSQPGGSGPVPSPSSPGGSGPAPPLGGGTGGGGHSPFQTAAAPAVGGGQPAASGAEASNSSGKKEKINPDEKFRPPSRDSKALNIVLWSAFLVLMAAAVVLLLGLFDVVDIPLLGDDADEEVVAQQADEEPASEEAVVEQEEPAEEEDDVAAIDQLLAEAQDDINANRLGPALEQLEEATQLDAERVEIYELKAVVHEEFGDGDEAEAMRERAEELRAEQEEGDEEEPDEEGDE